jgi:hypothetical protein
MEPTKLIVALALAALAGCTTTHHVADPIPKAGEMTRKISWVITEDPHATCQKIGKKPLFFKTLGCAVWRDSGNCVIYTRAPRNEDDRRAMETMGHEMLHCFVGHFHRPS